jgi:hypothetical protein
MNRKRFRQIVVFPVSAFALFLIGASLVFAFNGPTNSPGVGSGAFTIDGNGNVGIGSATSTPTTGSFGAVFGVSSTTNPAFYLKNPGGRGFVLYSNTASTSFAIFDETAGADRLFINSSGNVIVPGNITATAFVGTLSGDVSAANVTSAVFGSLQGNGAFAFPGSLGIATSSKTGLPQELSVYGTGYIRDGLGVGIASPTSKVHVYSTSTAFDALLETSGGMKTAVGIDTTGGYAGTTSNHPFRLFSNNAEKLRVATSGNVGIGTTTPAYALSVSGEIYATGSSTAAAFCLSGSCQTSWTGMGQWTSVTGGIYYMANVSVGTSTATAYPLLVSTSTDSLFAIRRAGSTYPTIFKQGTDGVLVVNNANLDTLTLKDGSVGIGVTSPGQKLAVASSSGISVDVTGGRIVNLGAPSSGSDAATKTYVDNAVVGAVNYFALSGTNLYPTSTTYDLGVGTTTPSYKIDAVGDVNASGAYRIAGASALEITGGQLRVGTSSAITSLALHTGGAQRLVINSSGQVGIASSSPGYGLVVEGTSYFSQPVFVGTPTNPSHAATKTYVDSLFVDGSFTTLTVSATTTLNGTTTVNGNWNLAGAALGNINLNSNNIVGVNKLTVSTIDPVYEIAGRKYATYVSDTIGLKMEAYGKGRLAPAHGSYEYSLDFANAREGSELWLFWQTAKEGADMEDIVLTLTAEGGKSPLWYELRPAEKRIVVKGDAPVAFSYHIVAPRHDAGEWPTVITPEHDDGSRPTRLKLR